MKTVLSVALVLAAGAAMAAPVVVIPARPVIVVPPARPAPAVRPAPAAPKPARATPTTVVVPHIAAPTCPTERRERKEC
jgi:hypothetical protein